MKWMNARIAIALVASLGLALGPACSDDETSGQDNDTGVEEDAGDDAGTPDVEDTDVPDDTGDTPDADDPDTGEEPDAPDPDENYFDVDPVECAYPADDPECAEEDGDFGPGSFFSYFQIAVPPEEDCCFDVDGEGGIDNHLGGFIIPLIESFGIPGFDDVNENLSTSIQSGELTYLFETYGWTHPLWDQGLRVRVYQGGDSQGDYMAGEGEFWISELNFDDDGNPRYGFDKVEIRDGAIAAEGGRIRIMFPGLVDAISAELDAVQMVGRIVQNPQPDLEAKGHFAIEEGRLGGALIRDTFFKTLNQEALGCDCLDLSPDIDLENPNLYEDGIFIYNPPQNENHPGSWSCDVKSTSDENICAESGDPVCFTLGDAALCGGLSLISDNTDIVIDGDHAYSIGARFESVPATIMGIDE